MSPWFLRDPERFKLERKSIEELSRSAEWLLGAEWLFDKGLCIDAVIHVHGYDYEVRVEFPFLYPDAPITVRPRNMENRISSHQYGGKDGPLCLEWGPDNWHRDVTAVQMLESAFRLFDIENPLGEDRPEAPVVAPSRHQLTLGQELRSKHFRWFESKSLSDYFQKQPDHSIGTFKFSLSIATDTWISLVQEVMPLGSSVWKDDQIPTNMPGADWIREGIWLKTDLNREIIGKPNSLTELRNLFSGTENEKSLATDGTCPVDSLGKSITGVLIIDGSGELHFFIVFSDESVRENATVQSGFSSVQIRSPEWSQLNRIKIGIVGLGSVGSKISMCLARMGVHKFYLVDHDVLLPENLQRHALDWLGVTLHKVDAVKAAIDRVAPGAQVEVCDLHITGQESNALVSGTLNRLAACDILIDATADPKVFNLLSAVARTANRPMVWMEVFGGGLGGLIARSRPGIDPIPQDMRCAYNNFCIDYPCPDLKPGPDYTAETEDGEVLIASDADVAIIANHAVRLVPDCITPPENSIFPNSMYLIGLKTGWVFEAPFATIPISMKNFNAEGCKTTEKEIGEEDLNFLLGLLKEDGNATDTTPGNNTAAN